MPLGSYTQGNMLSSLLQSRKLVAARKLPRSRETKNHSLNHKQIGNKRRDNTTQTTHNCDHQGRGGNKGPRGRSGVPDDTADPGSKDEGEKSKDAAAGRGANNAGAGKSNDQASPGSEKQRSKKLKVKRLRGKKQKATKQGAQKQGAEGQRAEPKDKSFTRQWHTRKYSSPHFYDDLPLVENISESGELICRERNTSGMDHYGHGGPDYFGSDGRGVFRVALSKGKYAGSWRVTKIGTAPVQPTIPLWPKGQEYTYVFVPYSKPKKEESETDGDDNSGSDEDKGRPGSGQGYETPNTEYEDDPDAKEKIPGLSEAPIEWFRRAIGSLFSLARSSIPELVFVVSDLRIFFEKKETIPELSEELVEWFQRAIGSLLFLARSLKPELAFVVSDLSIFFEKPSFEHVQTLATIFEVLRDHHPSLNDDLFDITAPTPPTTTKQIAATSSATKDRTTKASLGGHSDSIPTSANPARCAARRKRTRWVPIEIYRAEHGLGTMNV